MIPIGRFLLDRSRQPIADRHCPAVGPFDQQDITEPDFVPHGVATIIPSGGIGECSKRTTQLIGVDQDIDMPLFRGTAQLRSQFVPVMVGRNQLSLPRVRTV
jgi:hypothetical protein